MIAIEEIQEVKEQPRGFFDKSNQYLFYVKTRSLKRTFYTNNKDQTLDWISRISQAIEYFQVSRPIKRQPSWIRNKGSAEYSTATGNESTELVEDDMVVKGAENLVEPERVSLSSFTIISELGSGSFGKVYKAFKNNTRELVAIKALSKKHLEQKRQLKYAIVEARVMKTLDHPNIVKLKYCFQTKKNLYLVLEYCPNGDLGAHLHQCKKFDEDRARFYIAQTMLALEYLHNRDIVYRDLKPDNLLLDLHGNIKLTDFGLVRDQITNTDGVTASFCGSPAYLAPEMIKDNISSKSGDIYTLGTVLFEMLTGKTPFYTKHMSQLFHSITNEKLKVPVNISQPAKDFIIRTMNKDPSRRGCIQTLLGHRFFASLHWDSLERFKLAPPRLGSSWNQIDEDVCLITSSTTDQGMTVDIDEVDEHYLIKEFTV